jgi:hypothetical protein
VGGGLWAGVVGGGMRGGDSDGDKVPSAGRGNGDDDSDLVAMLGSGDDDVAGGLVQVSFLNSTTTKLNPDS